MLASSLKPALLRESRKASTPNGGFLSLERCFLRISSRVPGVEV